MHAYISAGLFAPWIWNIHGVQIGWFAFRHRDILSEVIQLVTHDVWTEPTAFSWFLFELVLITLLVTAHLGWKPLHSMVDGNIHGGNFNNHHIFVRKEVLPQLIPPVTHTQQVQPGTQPILSGWFSNKCPLTGVPFQETFRLALPHGEASRYALVPMVALYSRTSEGWWFASQITYLQHWFVTDFVRMWLARNTLQPDDVIVVSVKPLSWLRHKREVARVF
jgi:hypothetical protein